MRVTISVSIAPTTLDRLDTWRGPLSRGDAIEVLLRHVLRTELPAPVEVPVQGKLVPHSDPPPKATKLIVTTEEPAAVVPTPGERVVEPLPPWEV